ncbi:D-alanyl-D-alanine carboxypeptidase family protein [Corynebacterium crudilactis]|uniref:D-alanyl-D-alanine carboxypeptidase n=1 Tax=Corynebacterium crudilactis TaxID=1652495 RepID=A0A172QRR5_9CORY|nr:D-alanyl-D-alanine carboxypeptidase family protein [Corynebacterium crudilactis]ANE03350.1 D-alanyl-D-alanine carboxypeptidase [Corynebacterium crudilactis]
MRKTLRHSCTALLTAWALLLPTAALAQEPIEAEVTADNAESIEDIIEDSALPTTREAAPNTDLCPNKHTPAPARTTSEVVAPGMETPVAIPVPAVPAGGEQMAACGVIAPDVFELPPQADKELTASAWMVFDIDSGEILAAKDPHGRYRPASIIKVLLSLVAMEELDPLAVVTGTADAADIEGSRVGVGEGGQYTVDQLLHGLLLASGNDAAYLLAQELGGDQIALEKVNALAKQLGAQDTFAATYSGLDAPGMSTSAYDMSLIYQHAWQNPTFKAIIGTDHIAFPGWGDNEGFEVWNDNALFMNDPDGIGGKTGYTDDANHTFVGGLDRGGRRLAAVILDSTVTDIRPWEQARLLIDASLRTPPGSGVGQLGSNVPAELPTTVPEMPESTDTPTQDIGGSEDTMLKIIVALGVIAVLLIAALAWTFRRRN